MPSNDSRNNCVTRFGSNSLLVCKVANGCPQIIKVYLYQCSRTYIYIWAEVTNELGLSPWIATVNIVTATFGRSKLQRKVVIFFIWETPLLLLDLREICHQSLIHQRHLSSKYVWKIREIYHCGLWKNLERLTDACKLGIWEGYHLSKGLRRKGIHFLSKMVYKRVRGWTSGRSLSV